MSELRLFSLSRELNAWGQDVEDLSVLSELPYIEVLAVACNRIRTLK